MYPNSDTTRNKRHQVKVRVRRIHSGTNKVLHQLQAPAQHIPIPAEELIVVNRPILAPVELVYVAVLRRAHETDIVAGHRVIGMKQCASPPL